MIDKATVQRIKDTANIVEVVSDYVHLTRRGSNYMGLCPFHNERTPSFSVNPRRNICRCFSCGKGGSPVNFLMQKENISYYDALKQLAKKYGIKVEERELTPEERRLATEREGLLIAAEAAMRHMESDLLNDEEGRSVGLAYLYHRGVTDEAVKAFHLGYALDRPTALTDRMLHQGFDLETLRKLGITGEGRNGGNYDKYRGRVIFPIMNSSGKTVGFGGRDLKGTSPAKYINSPESVLYRKNNELYGIFQAKNEIIRQDRCFLVEGYLDVISMWQSGLKNVVASSGTALTDGQIAMIHRFSSNITLLYDGDAAGIKAALRGIDMLLSHKMKVSVLLLPDGHDPDSFARANTPEDFRAYVEAHSTDIIRFKMDVLLKDVGDDPQRKAAVVQSVVNSIACIEEGVERTIYIGECARVMRIDEAAVASAVETARFKIVEQQRQDRRRKTAMRDFPDGDERQAGQTTPPATPTVGTPTPPATPTDTPPAGSPAQPQGAATPTANKPDAERDATISAELVKTIDTQNRRTANPLFQVEHRMIELIVKFGYIQYVAPKEPTSSDNSDNSGPQNRPEQQAADNSGAEDDGYYPIIDFVNDELEADKIGFTDPSFQKIFTTLLDGVDDFLEAYEQKIAEVESRQSERLEQSRAEIAASSSTIADIERAERKLNEQMLKERDAELREFARYYPGDILVNHEDGDIRNVATDIVSEKYVLSTIFTKAGTKAPDEEESKAVVRALTEWKSEVINLMVRDAINEMKIFNDALCDGDFTEVERHAGHPVTAAECMEMLADVQRRINSLMAIRSKAARNTGDRILSPRDR